MPEEVRQKIILSKRGKGNGRTGYKHTEETKEKMRQARIGKNYFIPSKKGIRNSPDSIEATRQKQIERFKDKTKHHRWIKDRSKVKVYPNKKADSLYKQWMLDVKRRDCWTCRVKDDSCLGGLEAHHILNWCEYPELRYSLKNGITLCHAHHPRGRAKEKEMEELFKEIINNITTHNLTKV